MVVADDHVGVATIRPIVLLTPPIVVTDDHTNIDCHVGAVINGSVVHWLLPMIMLTLVAVLVLLISQRIVSSVRLLLATVIMFIAPLVVGAANLPVVPSIVPIVVVVNGATSTIIIVTLGAL
jgi:hypothetical protein